ncbi:MAG: Glutamate racemase [Parcubacteria group bacterium GW2011_GWA2_36_10]|nr:MAG: Glutamate racemase [Parcubacteria group bacterium GW2011_GWA2_36_10]
MLKNKRQKAIGVFDSGFGGLNIMQSLVKVLPKYDFVYLGDTARIPYGTRSPEVVYEFTKQAVDFLFAKKCELIIFACNTASSDALRHIQREYLPKYYPSKKVLGVIIPTVEVANSKTKNKKIGVIATEGTVLSGAFSREILKINPQVKVWQNACPLLVSVIEAGEQDSVIMEILLKKYLKPLIAKKIDTLILGCTHYGILKNKIKKIIGNKIHIISEAEIVASKLKDYLKRHSEIESKLSKKSVNTFYSTDLTDKFQLLGTKFFGKKITVQKAKLI